MRCAARDWSSADARCVHPHERDGADGVWEIGRYSEPRRRCGDLRAAAGRRPFGRECKAAESGARDVAAGPGVGVWPGAGGGCRAVARAADPEDQVTLRAPLLRWMRAEPEAMPRLQAARAGERDVVSVLRSRAPGVHRVARASGTRRDACGDPLRERDGDRRMRGQGRDVELIVFVDLVVGRIQCVFVRLVDERRIIRRLFEWLFVRRIELRCGSALRRSARRRRRLRRRRATSLRSTTSTRRVIRMAHLRPCIECHRHVRGSETRCPFCDAELSVVGSAGVKPGAPLTRAAILFGAAATVAACVTGGPDTPGPSSSSSGGSSSGNTSSSSGAVPAYGVPEIDSGDDTNDAGAVALYGPAPVPDGG